MKNTFRIVAAILILASFAGGYVARRGVAQRWRSASEPRPEVLSTRLSGTRVASANPSGVDVDLRPLQTLLQVVTGLREQYVERITPADESKMTVGAVKSMLRSLEDPNTRYVSAAQRKILMDAAEGRFHGIGAWMAVRRIKAGEFTNEHLTVVAPMPGSPAEKAGLKPGDDITEIDGKSVLAFDPFQRLGVMVKESRHGVTDRALLKKQFDEEKKRIEQGLDVDAAEDLLTSEDTKKMELTVVAKATGKPTKIQVQPTAFALEPVTSGVESGQFGYIRVNCFCSTTAAAFDQAMRDLKDKPLKGLILDLRNVSGGDTSQVLGVVRWFAPGKTVATVVRSRNRRTPLKAHAIDKSEVWTKPVVVITNRGTAGMPEVLAGSLRDLSIARTVGEKSYGDFAETTLIDQPDGSAILLTTGVYLTAKGANLSGKGVPVDVAVAPGRSGDAALKAAASALSGAGARS